MRIEIITTGTELLLGRILNTHQRWLCRRLADLGYTVDRQVTVPDTGWAIQQAIREALARADFVITTGGLGPTRDDRTRDLVAELLGRKLRQDEAVIEAIRKYFASRKRPQPASTEVQALVPEGALVLPNAFGTAPGLALEIPPGQFRSAGAWLVMLPGPPRELHPMFDAQVAPLLQSRFPLTQEFVCRTLRTTGIGESQVEERIDLPLRPLLAAGLELGYCAGTGAVDIRLASAAPDARRLVTQAEEIVRGIIRPFLYGVDDESMESVVVRLLAERKQTIAVAESCTGGFVAHRLTNVPGASAVFPGGLLTYSNEAKQTLLGVPAAMLAEHGAVSESVARAMAAGARDRLGADFALSLTGIAGPTGGRPDKPVGTVFIGLASAHSTRVKQYLNTYDRETFKLVSSQQALELLRRAILQQEI